MTTLRPTTRGLDRRNDDIIACTRCERLIQHCARVAREKRKAYRDESYWGRPVPSFGDPFARLIIVGLAPAAHGANRTGRMFTGDRSGDWLYRALHKAGFASQRESRHAHDRLQLRGAWISAAAHCAPPDNRPTREELRNCNEYLSDELRVALGHGRAVVVSLGGIAFDSTLATLRDQGVPIPRPKPKFTHLAEYDLGGLCTLIGSYHPSQQNTHTGRLTEDMLDAVFHRAQTLVAQFSKR